MYRTICVMTLSLLLIAVLSAPILGASICGDANGDTEVNLGDPVYLVNYIFKNGPAPVPVQIGDANADGIVNVGDAVFLIQYVFNGGSLASCVPSVDGFSNSGCKTFLKDAEYHQDCIEWAYDGQAILTIKHKNAGFNCCPGEIYVSVSVENEVITVSENEQQDACDCNCLFDFDYSILFISPGKYTITVQEPYYFPGDGEPLEFDVDLTGENSGVFCATRTRYPW